MSKVFTARIVATNELTYFISYNATWGLESVRKGTQNGEVLFSASRHMLIEGQLHEMQRGVME